MTYQPTKEIPPDVQYFFNKVKEAQEWNRNQLGYAMKLKELGWEWNPFKSTISPILTPQ